MASSGATLTATPGGAYNAVLTPGQSTTATQSGAAVSVTNASYDGSLAAAGSATFGLLGSGTAPASLGSVQCTEH